MSSIISRSEWAFREDKVLHLREIVPQFLQTKAIGFSPNKLRSLDRTAAKIEHDGCINIVKWHQSGANFLTGSDDRNIKLWSLTNDLENVLLKHTMCTRHRGNIFYVDFSPVDGNVVYSVAADGTLRSNHLNQRNAGELLRTSTDMIHMFHIDQEQPKVIYTAEEEGSIYRLDLRTDQSEKIFTHSTESYLAFATDNDFHYVPDWPSSVGSVKSIVQNHTFSQPHLVVGGQGYTVGLLDFRIATRSHASRSGSSNAATIPTFVKLWSPLFPMGGGRCKDTENLYEEYQFASMTHPFGTVSWEEPIKAKSVTRRFEGVRGMSSASISGLEISKNGRQMVASFQGDQVYTFDFYNSSGRTTDGCRAVMGGHTNYATFLKSVHFFGPNDEYVVSGSDTGHIWIWGSKPCGLPIIHVPSAPGQGGQFQQVTLCPLINLLKADGRTCNGAVPHPTEPILVSYGIDSDAKLWAVRDPTEHLINIVPESKYPLCRHDGPRDKARYSRISLNPKPRPPLCMLHTLPQILVDTKKQISMMFPDFIENPRGSSVVMFPADYVDTAMILLQARLTNDVILPSISDEQTDQIRNYFRQDYSAYLPLDEMLRQLKFRSNRVLLSEYVFRHLKKQEPLHHYSDSFWHYLLRRYCILHDVRALALATRSIDVFSYLPFRSMDTKRSKLFNFLFLAVLELCRVAEDAKVVGSLAFRQKDFGHAHFFYCKAQRYTEYVLQLRLVQPTESAPNPSTGVMTTTKLRPPLYDPSRLTPYPDRGERLLGGRTWQLEDSEEEEDEDGEGDAAELDRPGHERRGLPRGVAVYQNVDGEDEYFDRAEQALLRRQLRRAMRGESRSLVRSPNPRRIFFNVRQEREHDENDGAEETSSREEDVCDMCEAEMNGDDENNSDLDEYTLRGSLARFFLHPTDDGNMSPKRAKETFERFENIDKRYWSKLALSSGSSASSATSVGDSAQSAAAAPTDITTNNAYDFYCTYEYANQWYGALKDDQGTLSAETGTMATVDENERKDANSVVADDAGVSGSLDCVTTMEAEEDELRTARGLSLDAASGAATNGLSRSLDPEGSSPPHPHTHITHSSGARKHGPQSIGDIDTNTDDDGEEQEKKKQRVRSPMPTSARGTLSAATSARQQTKATKRNAVATEAESIGAVPVPVPVPVLTTAANAAVPQRDLTHEMATWMHRQAYEIMVVLYSKVLPELMLTVYANLAATFIAMEKYADAVNVCNDCFAFAKSTRQKVDAKVYFRRGSSYMQLQNYEDAVVDLQEAAALQPKDAGILHKLAEAKRQADAKKKREMRAYSRMFGGP